MEQELKYKLLPGKTSEYFKFNVNSYLRGTALDRAQYYKEMRYAGLLTEQEGRILEDLPKEPVEGQLLIPKNIWGTEEYKLELERRRKELNAND
jgi:phage portal protein BeeE